jgi:hypothetical protein
MADANASPLQIRFEDLFVRCPVCNGNKVEAHTIEAPPGPTGLPGDGHGGRGERPCTACKASGGTITPSGEAVLQFLKQVGK